MSRQGPTTRSRQKPARGCARAFATTFAPASVTAAADGPLPRLALEGSSRSAWAAAQYHAAAGFDGRGRTELARRPADPGQHLGRTEIAAHEDRAGSRIDSTDYLTSPSNNRAGRA